MDFNDVKARIKRVYASIGQLRSDDYEKKVRWTPGEFDIHFGSTDDPEDENIVVGIISALADLKDNIKNRMSALGKDPKLVEAEINGSLHLQLITDLDNQNKHGYPLTKTKRSGLYPLIRNVESSFQVSLNGTGGMFFNLMEEKVEFEDGAAAKIILDAEITDGAGNLICSLDIMVNDALAMWEQFIAFHGLT